MKFTIRDVITSGPPTIDRRGLLFQVDGRVFRAFRGDEAVIFRRLLAADWLTDLFDAGLVKFDAADVSLEGFDLVVEAERVPVITYPPEWPTAMLRESGSTIARLGAALARRGLGYLDAHPWNVLFDGPRSVFVDLGSIVEGVAVTRSWAWEFRRHVVLPLALHQVGLHALADSIQRTQRGSWTGRFDRGIARPFPPRFALLDRLRKDPIAYFDTLERYMRGPGQMAARTAWSRYYTVDEPEVGSVEAYNDKQRSTDLILGRLPSGSVLDVGANQGRYSRLAATKGHSVVSLDLDDHTLGALFQIAKDHQLPILPVRMDLMWPSGTGGLALEYRAAPDRLRSDIVLVLAVLHHLTEFQGITFEVFARAVSMFSNRVAVIEFVPRDDQHLVGWEISQAPWYNVDGLTTAMEPYFRLVETLPSTPSPRQILVFEKH